MRPGAEVTLCELLEKMVDEGIRFGWNDSNHCEGRVVEFRERFCELREHSPLKTGR